MKTSKESCLSKQVFFSKKQAEDRAKALEKKTGIYARCYKCDRQRFFQPHYHITHLRDEHPQLLTKPEEV